MTSPHGRTSPLRYDRIDDAAAPPSRRRGRSRTRPARRGRLANAAPVAALGDRPRVRSPARSQEPGDEPDVAVPLRAVLGGAGARDVRDPGAGLRHWVLEPDLTVVGRAATDRRPMASD